MPERKRFFSFDVFPYNLSCMSAQAFVGGLQTQDWSWGNLFWPISSVVDVKHYQPGDLLKVRPQVGHQIVLQDHDSLGQQAQQQWSRFLLAAPAQSGLRVVFEQVSAYSNNGRLSLSEVSTSSTSTSTSTSTSFGRNNFAKTSKPRRVSLYS